MIRTRRPRRLAVLGPVLLLAALLLPVGAAAAEPSSFEALIGKHRLPAEAVGFLVLDAASGEVLEARDPDTPFVPASAIKIPTAVAALGVLGTEHRFETTLRMTGSVRDGTLHGDLYLRGGGDPVLTTDDYRDLVDRLAALGVRRITGGFHYDAGLFPTLSAIDPDHADDVAYNPGVGALSLNFNRVRLKWERGVGERRLDLDAVALSHTDRTEIPLSFLSIGFAPAGSAAPRGLIYREQDDRQEWLLLQNVGRKGEIWLPVRHPGFHAAYVFRRIAEQKGIALPDARPGTTPANARPVALHASIPLPRISSQMLYFSNNMTAEMIGLATAVSLRGEVGSIRDASVAISKWLSGKVEGVDWLAYDVRNNSGLSTETRITARQLAAILSYASRQDYGRQRFADLMAPFHIGREGHDVPKGVRVRAKTGAINHSIAVAGYAKAKSGRDLVFALFVSDYRLRDLARDAGRTHQALPPRTWMNRARALRRDLVQRWALAY